MSTTAHPVEPSVAAPATRSRSRRLGAVALLLVPVALAVETVLGRVASVVPGLTDVGAIGLILGVELLGLAAAFVLGLVAVVTGRGRGAGMAAMVLALLCNVYAFTWAQQLGQSFAR